MIALILDAIPAPVWAGLAAFLAFVAAWFAGRRGGTKAAENKAALNGAAAYQKTMEAMADAGNDDLGDDDVRRRLRDRATKR